ncbi:hypothetical protein D3227_04865 [Mesorhizobium waimense]|uniref:Large polyvalent protein associated domain-containing protein n=1 Tax=Mesorhizobium waimense TaxID=1300307 RepID=A0A3A5LCD5_9HYPH|nr:hypothetical protein [Mesorhizobium waimense]RJT42012.1 hypothetical protein D3227_04865 [Mesorhizobium waimense]
MDTIADYNAWKDKQQQSGVGAAQVVLGSVNEKPDQVAGDVNLANEFGKATGNPVPPLPMVREYRNVFQQKIEEQKNKTILSTSPRLTDWLRSPDNAALARDDLQNLSWFEGFGRGATNTLSRSGDRLSQMGNQFMLEQTAGRASDRDKSFGQILESEQTGSGLRDMQGQPLKTWTGSEYLGAFGRWVDARYADMIGTDDAAAATQFAAGVKDSQDRLAATPKSATAQAFESAAIVKDATPGEALANFGAAFLRNPVGGLSWALETAGESAPQLAAALVAGRISPSAGVAALGGGSYVTERYTAPADFLSEKGIDLGKPEDVQRLLADPKIMEEAANRGVIRGSIVGAFDLLSGGLAGKALVHNPIVEAIAQSAQQAILGAAGEYSARVAAGQPVDWNDVIAEGVAEIATAPVEMGAAGREFAANRRKAKVAEGTVAQLGEISANAQASQVRARTPDTFRQFVEAATANGPVENVYVPAEQFATYFQSLGVDPHALVDELEGMSRDDLDVALAGGGDLQIPTATYAAKLAGTDHDAFLMENMRFDPNEFTALEAKEFNERAQDALDEAWQVAEADRLDEEASRSHEQQIYDTMVSQLRAAGRSTDVATTEAALYPAFYRTMAERSGQTVEDFMRAYPLPQVRGSLPEGMQFRDVDALNRTLAEARAQRSAGLDKRQSLLEFISDYGGINDVGGDIKAMDAATIKRKGKKTLKIARGTIAGVRDMFGQASGKKHGLDDVAQAAIEAGFLANDPVATEYRNAIKEGRQVPNIGKALLDAIGREMRGEADHAAPVDAAKADHNAQLDQIEAYLSGLGVSLDDSDAAIREAVQADQADEAKKYAQPAYHGTPHLFDKFSTDHIGTGEGAGIPGHQYVGHESQKTNYVIYDDSRVAVTSFEQSGDVRGPRGSIQFPGGGVGNGDTVVRLFESADLSTFLHESGHYFLTVLRDLADKGEASAAGDMGSVKEWWSANADAVAKDAMRVMPDVTLTADDVNAAINNGTTGDLMKDAAIDVGMQEQWARGFESYLMEGKAPSIELRGAFEKFRSWLISVYRRLAGLNVTVSDGIREVFDRMIASDEEIAKAKDQAGDRGPIFATAEEMGLTPGEFASLLKLRDQAEDDAKARLLREAMAPVKRAQEKWFKDERAKVRDEVEGNVNTYRYYRAMEWMGNRRWWGEGKPEDMPDIRLSKDILVELYGEGVLKTLPRGMQTMYAVEGGIDPDEAAGWFGFDSGDELIQAMEKAPPRKQAIEAETDKLMRERHGDVLTDGSIEAEALAALHSDRRGQWIAAELKAVVEVAGTGIGMTAKEARATARASIARMRVRDAVNSIRFLAAERKAADEAAKLGAMLARDKVWVDAARRRIESKARAASKGKTSPDTVATAINAYNEKFATTQSTFTVPDREAVSKSGNAFTIKGGERTATSHGYNDLVARLIETKRRQLLNHALYMEARNVIGEVDKAENFVAKLAKKSTREKIAGAGRRENARVDYLSAIDELLERYDFRKLSGAAESRRGALNAFVAAMTAAGRENELAIPEGVLSDAARRPYKTLPVEELRGVVDTLKNLEHVALRWNKLIDTQKQRDLDAVIVDVVAAFDANMPKRPPGRVGTKRESLRHSVRQFFDLVLNAGTILREIDGFKDMGAAYRNIKTPIDEAADRLTARKEKAASDLESLYAVYAKEDRRRMAVRHHIPELGYALSKWERIAVALNLGNEGNRARLTDTKVRGSLTEAQISAVIAKLDARDADFVQSVWDYVGSFRDDIAARERRATGVEPQWVEATPVDIAGKTLKGGYYPLKYDPRLSSLARDDETNDIATALQAGRFGKAQTRQGHLKERARSSGRDVELDMSVLHRHVNQVIYDLELSEPVANSWRILQSGEVRSAFMDAGKQADFDALEIWLKDVAEGELKSADLVGRAARTLKSNFTAAKLAFNLSTVAMQVTGLSQSMVVVGKKDMAVGIMQAAKNPISMARDIAAKSQFMATRQTTFNKDIFDFYSDPKTGPVASRWGEIKAEIVGPLAFWLMTKTQWYLADVPTWLAGYRQGLRQNGNDETKAVAHADAVVKRAQASGLFADRSAVERGSVSRTARQNDVVRLFTALGSYMFAKFNVAYERTAKAKRLIGDEGLSARSGQEALSWTLDMAFLFTLEAVIGAAIKGQLPSGDGGDDDDGWMAFLAKQTGFSVMATIPGVRDITGPLQGFDGGGSYGSITKEIATPFLEGGKSVQKGEVRKQFIKSIVNATGLATGLPATQINRAVDAAWRQADGKDVSPLEYLLGRLGK